jgi:FG-GAP repeat
MEYKEALVPIHLTTSAIQAIVRATTRVWAPLALALLVFMLPGNVTAASPSPVVKPKAILTQQGLNGYSFYGSSVAVSGDGKTALVGAPSSESPGGAYLYTRSSAGWKSRHHAVILTVAGLVLKSYAGYSVSLSHDGRVAVVGAYRAAGISGKAVPSAYVFIRPKSGWKSTTHPNATLTFVGDKQGSGFGTAVAISGNGTTILVGANSTNFPFGEAYVFTKPAGGWKTTANPKAALSTPNGDFMGYTASLNDNGSIALLGTNSAPGGAFIFARGPHGWADQTTATAQLSVQGLNSNAQYGYSVSLSGDGKTALVGSLQDPGGFNGRAYVFIRKGSAWHDTVKPKAHLSYSGASDFGASVALNRDGSTAVVGQDQAADDPTEAAYMYRKPAGGWKTTPTPAARFTQPDATSLDAAYGYAVSVSGDGKTSLVGIPNRAEAAAFVK